MGLLHGPSGTCALDVDNVAHTRLIFEALGIDYDAIIASAPKIVGRPDRGKVLFRAPAGEMLTTRKISWPVDGDPRKTEIAFAQTYFAVQTRRAELIEALVAIDQALDGLPETDAVAALRTGRFEAAQELVQVHQVLLPGGAVDADIINKDSC